MKKDFYTLGIILSPIGAGVALAAGEGIWFVVGLFATAFFIVFSTPLDRRHNKRE